MSFAVNVDDMDDTAAARTSHLSHLRHFYDVSWNLFKCLGTPPAIERENLIESIRLTLLKQPFDDDEDTSSRRIELSECTLDPISFRLGTSTFSGVAIYAEFTSGLPFRFIHYSHPAKEVSLLLFKGGMGGLSQGLTDSFFEMVGLSPYQRVELPSSLLSSQFESYLEALVPHAPPRNRESFIQNVVGKLDITVTAEAPVAPNLRSLNISVPATDVWAWLHSSPQQGTFLSRLSDYIQSTTGMQLDLGSSRGSHNGHKLKICWLTFVRYGRDSKEDSHVYLRCIMRCISTH